MSVTASLSRRLTRPASSGNQPQGLFFLAMATILVGIAYRASDAHPATATAAVLAVAFTTAMYARLALGRWPAAVGVVLAGVGLLVVGAPARLVGSTLIGGIVVSELVARRTGRAAVLRASVVTGVIVAGLILSGLAAVTPMAIAASAWEAAAALVGAVASAPLLLGFGPAAEWLFGHATPLTMDRWLNYSHPLLRDLAKIAPGTFQHAVNVGVLASRAAEAIGADALLARVGGLYHDVGKMKAPEFFSENQLGENPHDRLPPWESARILRAHVADGVHMVREHRMGGRVAGIVREHHGTAVMRSLLEKAATATSPSPEPYRYDGPRPQSRESAIVMIADQVEATARSQPPTDAAEAAAIVTQTVERIGAAGELGDVNFSARQVRAISSALADVLVAMYHRRMPYPNQRVGPTTAAPRWRVLGWRKAR